MRGVAGVVKPCGRVPRCRVTRQPMHQSGDLVGTHDPSLHCPSPTSPHHNPMPARAAALPGRARATRGLVRGHPCPHSPSSHHPTTIPCRRGCRCSQERHAPHEVWSAGILARNLRHHPTHNPMPARAPALPGKARATRGLVRGHPGPQCPSSHHPTHHNPVPARATALPGKARATPGLVRGHPCPCVPTKSPDGCIGCRVTRQRGTLPHGFTTPATPRSPLAPAGVRHTA